MPRRWPEVTAATAVTWTSKSERRRLKGLRLAPGPFLLCLRTSALMRSHVLMMRSTGWRQESIQLASRRKLKKTKQPWNLVLTIAGSPYAGKLDSCTPDVLERVPASCRSNRSEWRWQRSLSQCESWPVWSSPASPIGRPLTLSGMLSTREAKCRGYRS